MQPQLVPEHSNPKEILSTVFGYDSFRGEQEAIISHLIAGESCCVLMPTGSGKSLCYQIPALCRHGVGIVISPLIALMDNQVAELQELGVHAAALHSALGPGEARTIYQDMSNGTLDLLYVSPERLVMDDFLDRLDNTNIALLAIDEAHCISQWGHDFRPEYRQLAILRTRYPSIPVIAVTATADEPTRHDIMRQLNLSKLFKAGFDRPNIRYEVGVKESPRGQLLKFLKTREEDDSGIVYCLSRRKVEEIAQFLCDEGYNALPYHAGLDPDIRAANQNRFLKEEGIIMVATIAFGMGINKPNVRFVAHLDLPKNIEAYYQETGRAGRDGLPSVAWMVYGMQDVAFLRSMIDSSESPEQQKRLEIQKLNAFLGFCETAQCRRQVLLKYFGDRCEPCGNCDTCLNPPKTFDGTISAQKILSCIARVKEMFGSIYVIDILMGKDDERIRKNGHDNLSTFGIGKDHTQKEWQSILRQLLSLDFVHVDSENHGVLRLTEAGVRFLKEKNSIQLRLEEKIHAPSLKKASKQKWLEEHEGEYDQDLYRELKALRLQIAKEHNLPPYVIFHDKTLIEMAARKPQSLDEMGEINGVGQSKLTKYGRIFLETIKK